jgi:hypothetical protein
MKFDHPTIEIEQPAPGHYAVSGIPAAQVFIEGTGHVVAPNTLYISPAVPDELLEHILADRRAQQPKAAKGARMVGSVSGDAGAIAVDPGTLDQDAPLDHGAMPQGAPREVAPEAHTTAPAKPRRGRPAKGVAHK